MVKKCIHALVACSGKERSNFYKAASFVFAMVLFYGIFPGGLVIIGRLMNLHLVRVPWNPSFEAAVAWVSGALGLFFLVWSGVAHWVIGKGTPAVNAPTQNLIVIGPYKLCRNPNYLGGLFYYLAFGTIFDSLVTGLISFLVYLIIGSAYHKLVEEKELVLRFGEAYLEYKKNTPFLIPRFRRVPQGRRV